MKIVFTGATSFLAVNLINIMSQDNLIYCLVRKESQKNEYLKNKKNILIIPCDLSELKYYNPNFRADIFIHFGWSAPGAKGRLDFEAQNKNYDYSMDAINLAHRFKVKLFVFSGSQAEYGIKHNIIYENDICNPTSYYGKIKDKFAKAASKALFDLGINFLHLRIFSVYGKGDHETSLVNLCINSFLSNKKLILGPCSQLWNYLYIKDFANITSKVIHYAYDNNCSFVINIASHDTKKLQEFVKDIYFICNSQGTFYFGKDNPNPEGLSDLYPSTKILDEIIGNYNFIDFKQGIKEMIGETNEN